jgi:hypothetical protein
LASYADVHKALRKISVACNLELEKYKLKLRGYWTTDSKTPGIREYLIAVARMYKVELRSFDVIVETDDDGNAVLSEELVKLLTTDRDMFYRVAGGPHCVTDEDVPMMSEAIAHQVGFTASELQTWLESLEQCMSWDELDAFQLPGVDYDPDDEPEGTVRMAGPVPNLLATMPSGSKSIQLTIEDMVDAADAELEQYTGDGQAGTKAPPSAEA